MDIVLCIPTRNAIVSAQALLDGLALQSFRAFEQLVIDSSSVDDTPELFRAAGFRVHSIPVNEFGHGATRRLACNLSAAAEIIVFMTQDAVLATADSLQNLLVVFGDPRVAASYGRQIPAADANPIAAHARLFSYPMQGLVKTSADAPMLGIKTAFISNSFAAFRRSALDEVGGFPKHCIVSEDTYVAAKMLLSGWKVAYCADAQVYHSHNYNWRQEFQRYFDVGVFHAREPWVRAKFGGAEGEGCRFLKSEMKYLLHHAPYLVLSALFRTVIKYIGYRCGLAERYLPLALKQRLSMQKAFWFQEGRGGDDAARAGEAG